jgi:vacuolar-type H+-ATPase subunit C/Vma6
VKLKVTNKICKAIKKLKPKSAITVSTVEKVIFEYKDAAFPILKQCNRLELIRGLISNTIATKLQKLTSRKAVQQLTMKLLRHFYRMFQKYV